jgi:predicted RNA-binding Zn ribbon-like protein
MSPTRLFIGNHPAIDFLNTRFAPNGVETETIGEGRALLEWLVAAGLLDESAAPALMRRFGRKTLDETAAEARRLREWARTWLARWRAVPGGDYSEEIALLNKRLAGERRHLKVVRAQNGLTVVEQPQLENTDALLALLARQIALLVAREPASQVKACAGSGCTLWFLDQTKAHRRRFCSAAACGNRAKVAAFRLRQQG